MESIKIVNGVPTVVERKILTAKINRGGRKIGLPSIRRKMLQSDYWPRRVEIVVEETDGPTEVVFGQAEIKALAEKMLLHILPESVEAEKARIERENEAFAAAFAGDE